MTTSNMREREEIEIERERVRRGREREDKRRLYKIGRILKNGKSFVDKVQQSSNEQPMGTETDSQSEERTGIYL